MKTTKSNYFLVMSIIFLVIILVGFTPTFFLRPAFRDSALPTFLIVHGIVMVLWYVVYFHQSLLIYQRKVINHQRNGIYWFGLLILVYLTGINLLIQVSQNVVSGNITYASFVSTFEVAERIVIGDFYLLTTALILFIIAYRNRKRPEIHKRALFGASVILLQPAWDRFIHPIGLQEIHPLLKFAAINVFPVSLIVFDIIKRRKPYWITTLFFLMLILLLPIALFMINAGWAAKVVRFLGS